jgi:ankyrin repeat protein
MIENETDFDEMFPNKQDIIIYMEENKPLDIQDNYGDTLLMHVCFKEYIDIALKMLEYGPKAVNLSFLNKENNNLTALSIACIFKLKSVILKMLDYRPEETNINSQDSSGDTPIMILLSETDSNNSDLLEPIFKILDFGPTYLNLGLVNDKDFTALMIACKNGLQDIVYKMIENPGFDLNLFQEKDGETAYDIAYRIGLEDIAQLLRLRMQEEEPYQINIPMNTFKVSINNFNIGVEPKLSKEQEIKFNKINMNQPGWDPFLMENENIIKYLEEDKEDNIAIRYLNKIYLSKRSIVQQQKKEATVFECLEANKKIPSNIVKNLPLYNIKKIGINISSDTAVGIEPEYIYMNGIENILQTTDFEKNIFSIIPLDKILVSVISLEELDKIGTGFSGISALHCQAGQNALAGIIISAEPIRLGGKTMKRRKGNKKTLKKNLKKKTLKKNLKKISFRKNKK